MGSGLNTDSALDFAFGGAGLVFQEEIVFEVGEVWEDSEVSLTEMDEDRDLKNGVQIQVDKLNFEMADQSTKEIACREFESALEKGFGDYDFIGIGGRDVLNHSQPPLEEDVGRKKVVIDQAENLALIDGGGPKHLWV
jgi:hypothetical protein